MRYAEAVPTASHWSLLALFRFLLAAIVFNAHFGITIDPTVYHPIFHTIQPFGAIAAIMGFLLISGFSIAHSIEHRRGFYGRRVGRIFPVMIFTVLAFWVFMNFYVYTIPTHVALLNLLLLNGFIVSTMIGPAWTLAAEWLYYLAAPLLARCVTWVILIPAAGSGVLFFLIEPLNIQLPGVLHGISALALFWAWGLGFLAYRHLDRPAVVGVVLVAAALILMGNVSYEPGWKPKAVVAATGLVVAFGGYLTLPAPMRNAFDYLGDLSYPLYLVHMPIIFGIYRLFELKSYAAYVVIMLVACVFVLHVVDRPLRRRLAQIGVFKYPLERFAPLIIAGYVALVLGHLIWIRF